MNSKSHVISHAAFLKIFAVVFASFSAGAFPTARAADDAPAAPAQTEAQVPGDIQIARWDVILNDNGLESMDSVDNQTVHTNSKVYQAAIFNADALRGAVNGAAALNGLEAGSQSAVYSQSFNNDGNYNMQPLYFNYNFGPNARVGMQGNANGQEAIDKTDDTHIHVKLDYSNMNLRLMTYEPNRGMNQAALDKSASFSYDGQLTPGDALAFSASFKDKAGTAYRHVVVWEAFKSEPRYGQNFQMVRDSTKWCQLGPKWIRHYADVAAVWSAQAKHPADLVSAKWEQKLEDGKTLRLTGITRSDKYMYCWWDGDGQPISNNMWFSYQSYNKDQPVWFSAGVTGSSDEWKFQTPTGKPPKYNGNQSGPFNQSTVSTAGNDGKALIAVAVGPWEQVGEIKKGGTIKVGSVTYTLRNVQSMGTSGIYANFNAQRASQISGDMVVLTAALQDGTEVDTSFVPSMIATSNYGYSSQFQDIALKDVKTFHVWKRKMQWTTFTGFATEPVSPPKDQVTAEEVAAAVKSQPQLQQAQNVRVQQQLGWTKEAKAAWDAIPADPTTPKGALKAMFHSAASNDFKGVRARMTATQSNADPMLNAFARFITASKVTRTAAIARFGEDKVNEMQTIGAGEMAPPPMLDVEMMLASMPWEPRPDGGLTANEVSIAKGADGNYSMDLSSMMEQTRGLQGAAMVLMTVGIAQRLEIINQMLKDDPKMTVQQFRHALADTSLKPATQPATTKPAG